mmetsp:Transcript_12781/g.22609  ORF Transcript_12781/g.22609 Transcript_12781/m.22609 type:complete len:207 (-) Transcript_12781:67-687(-)
MLRSGQSGARADFQRRPLGKASAGAPCDASGMLCAERCGFGFGGRGGPEIGPPDARGVFAPDTSASVGPSSAFCAPRPSCSQSCLCTSSRRCSLAWRRSSPIRTRLLAELGLGTSSPGIASELAVRGERSMICVAPRPIRGRKPLGGLWGKGKRMQPARLSAVFAILFALPSPQPAVRGRGTGKDTSIISVLLVATGGLWAPRLKT